MLQVKTCAAIDLSVWVDVGNLNPADVSPLVNCGNSALAQTDRAITAVKMTVSHNRGTETPSENTPPLLGSSSNVQLKEEEEDDRDNLISVWNEVVRSKQTEKRTEDSQSLLPKDKASRSAHKLTHLLLLSIGIASYTPSNERSKSILNPTLENVEKKKQMKNFISNLRSTAAQKIARENTSPIISSYEVGGKI